MKHHLPSLPLPVLVIGLLSLCFGPIAWGQEPTAEVRLRETLRATMLQLRTSENERVALQTAQAEAETEKATLRSQVKTLTKQAAAEQEAARKAQAEWSAKVTEQTAQIKKLQEVLEQWQKAANDATELARGKESERARLSTEVAVLTRTVSEREAQNVALFKVGSEILNRLEKFGLGEAIRAREPFVGLKRVELQNLVQDYQDKLLDQKVAAVTAQ